MAVSRILTVFSLLTLLAACASSGGYSWAHATKSKQEYYSDNSECLARSNSGGNATQMPGDSGFAKGWNMAAAQEAKERERTIYNHCMKGKGWYLQSRSANTTRTATKSYSTNTTDERLIFRAYGDDRCFHLDDPNFERDRDSSYFTYPTMDECLRDRGNDRPPPF